MINGNIYPVIIDRCRHNRLGITKLYTLYIMFIIYMMNNLHYNVAVQYLQECNK